VWSKAGRFMEGLHAVGDILTKISVNCVINLHAALLFPCLFLWVLLYMLHVYVYCYFSVNLCIYRCIGMFTFYI
jgi:hypothetical protein